VGCIKLENAPQMSDFATWVTACEPALPYQSGDFMKAYVRNEDEQFAPMAADDRFIIALGDFLETQPPQDLSRNHEPGCSVF
jgi:hypothetical protein